MTPLAIIVCGTQYLLAALLCTLLLESNEQSAGRSLGKVEAVIYGVLWWLVAVVLVIAWCVDRVDLWRAMRGSRS